MLDQIITKEIFSVTLILFSVIDVVGTLPITINIQNKFGKIESLKITLVSGFLLFLFLFVGESILTLFGVDVQSFAVAGGMIMLSLGLEMVLNIEIFKHDPIMAEKSPIIPLAFPLLAGAGSMTTLISLNAEYQRINIILGIVLNLIVVYLTLKSASFIERKMGRSGTLILRKFFGTILIAMAIKLIKKNFIGIY
jgi:multiple antibiotic resistance protein